MRLQQNEPVKSNEVVMESILRSFLVLQLAIFFGIYFKRIKYHSGFSSHPMRLLRLGVFICMLLILFIDTDLLPASLGMSMALLGNKGTYPLGK